MPVGEKGGRIHHRSQPALHRSPYHVLHRSAEGGEPNRAAAPLRRCHLRCGDKQGVRAALSPPRRWLRRPGAKRPLRRANRRPCAGNGCPGRRDGAGVAWTTGVNRLCAGVADRELLCEPRRAPEPIPAPKAAPTKQGSGGKGRKDATRTEPTGLVVCEGKTRREKPEPLPIAPPGDAVRAGYRAVTAIYVLTAITSLSGPREGSRSAGGR